MFPLTVVLFGWGHSLNHLLCQLDVMSETQLQHCPDLLALNQQLHGLVKLTVLNEIVGYSFSHLWIGILTQIIGYLVEHFKLTMLETQLKGL